jgi:hypothetical protein
MVELDCFTFEDPGNSLPEEVTLKFDSSGIEVLEQGSKQSHKVSGHALHLSTALHMHLHPCENEVVDLERCHFL